MQARVEREKRIIETMIKAYCVKVHKTEELCADCKELMEYAEKRLLACPFLDNKPVCSKCSIHCYNKSQQEKIKQIMRSVGPKMIYTNPKDTLWYYFYKLVHKNQKITEINENPKST